MPNRARPRCPQCNAAMDPLYRHGTRGEAYVKIPDTFHCTEHNLVARGRDETKFG